MWLQSGEPRAHLGGPCRAKFKLSLRECPAPRRRAASPGGSENRAVEGLASRPPGWEWDGRRAGGGAPWGARPRRLRGKFSPTLEVWRPGREQPRYCWVGPGVGKNLWSKARAQQPAPGRPFWAGSRLGAEGGAEVV